MDDVWTAKEWDTVKAPLSFCAKGSKILVTSRSRDVTNAISHRKPYELGVLNDEHGWLLFKEKAFGEIDCYIEEELEITGKAITKKCGGVPLAIKVISGLLQGSAEEKWKAVLHNELWHVANDGDHQMFPALKISYSFLASPLKRCFQYFSIFPADYIFDKDDLVRMWIAEGFVENEEGRLLEDIGAEYFNELKGRSLIQGNDRVHDLIHCLACIMAKKFFYRVNSKASQSSKSVANRHVSFDGEYMLKTPYMKLQAGAESLRTLLLFRFSVSGSLDELPVWKSLRVLKLFDAGMPEVLRFICDMKQLRYLSIEEHRMGNFSESVCNNLINLHTLDLRRCLSLKSIPQNVGFLQHLTYLNLSRTQISWMPESVCNLHNLQVLDVRYCILLSALPWNIGNLRGLKKLLLSGSRIYSIPSSILKITGLQMLDNGDAELPPCIGKLANLESLKSYYVNRRPGRGIDELESMKKLKGSLFIFCMEKIDSISGALAAGMKNKKHINKLGFMWSSTYSSKHSSHTVVRDGEMETKIVEALEPYDPSSLKNLTFHNYSGYRLPRWMSDNKDLTILAFLSLDGLLHLEKLVNIELPSLKCLVLTNCPKLKEAVLVLPKLRRLEVFNCKELKAAALVLLPSISEGLTMNMISQLDSLIIDYIYLDYFLKQVQAGDGLPIKLQKLQVVGFIINMNSMNVVWLSVLAQVKKLKIRTFPRPRLQLLHSNDDRDVLDSLLKFTVHDCSSLTCLPIGLHKLSSLTDITISNCPSLISIQPEELPKNRSYLSIIKCESLKFLPDGLNNFLSLRILFTSSCPQLEVHPNHMFPPHLQRFWVFQCSRLQEQLSKIEGADWLYILR